MQSSIHSSHDQAANGITLIEVLVVLAVIAILFALSAKTLPSVKEKAHWAQCVGNLHQLGIGLQTEVSDSHEYPLLSGGTNGDGTWIGQLAFAGPGISQPLTNYAVTGIWRCPTLEWPPADKNYLPLSYGYNSGGVVADEESDNNFGLGGHDSTPIKDSEVKVPDEMMAIGDKFDLRLAITWDPTINLEAMPHRRHQGQANAVFCDGHVESPKLFSMFGDTNASALVRWNRDHQAHADLLKL